MILFWSLISFLLWGRQEAAGALWNLSFDDRNREAITAAGGVEALVWIISELNLKCLFYICININIHIE